LGGSGGRLWLAGNGLQEKKSCKSEKTRKKVQNNFRRTPVFLPKRAVLGPFLRGAICKLLWLCVLSIAGIDSFHPKR
jgi:hypothetical protein